MVYLTVRDISERLKISEYTICEYLKSGKLKGVKIGGKFWRVTEEDLQRYIKESEVNVK